MGNGKWGFEKHCTLNEKAPKLVVFGDEIVILMLSL